MPWFVYLQVLDVTHLQWWQMMQYQHNTTPHPRSINLRQRQNRSITAFVISSVFAQVEV